MSLAFVCSSRAVEIHRIVECCVGSQEVIHPALSPDGLTVVYAEGGQYPPFGEVFHWVGLKSLGGGAVPDFPFFEHNGELSSPAWSPHGQRLLAINRANWDSPDNGIWVFTEGAGAAAEQLAKQWPGRAAWSPGGDAIVYEDGGGFTVIQLDTGESYSLPVQGPAGHPAWASEGFAYVHNNHIWVADASGARAITAGESRDGWPSWSSDGRWIVYESNRSGNWDLWVVSRNGGTPVQLTRDPAFDGQPNWSPAGDKIAFVSERGGPREIWLVTDLPEFTMPVELETWSDTKVKYR